MVDKVFLHIGPPKTGSSYVQALLQDHTQELREHGIVLPFKSRPGRYQAVADLRGGLWATGQGRTWDDLVEAFAKERGTGVLSQEHFAAMTDPESHARAVSSLAPAEVHVVCAVRDPSRAVPANYQQAIRARSSLTYAEYLSRVREPADELWAVQSPRTAYEKWVPHLASPAHFHLVTVPRRGAEREELWRRFAQVIGAGDLELAMPAVGLNESIGVVHIELLRRFNAGLGERFPLPDPYIQNISRRLLAHGLRVGEQGERLGVPDSELGWLQERADQLVEDVEALGGEGVDVVGELDDLRADPPPHTRFPEEVGDDELVTLAVEVMARMLTFEEQQRETREARLQERAARARERAATADRERRAGAEEELRAYAATARGRVRRAAKALLGRV